MDFRGFSIFEEVDFAYKVFIPLDAFEKKFNDFIKVYLRMIASTPAIGMEAGKTSAPTL